MGDCTKAGHSVVSVKLSEVECIGHMQYEKDVCLGCIVLIDGVPLATEL